uniref:Uncharacterized protein n=1 Tax=Rhizophora mucronata TaxID=61149 RepID=A0A2P2Q3G2_RHIMU
MLEPFAKFINRKYFACQRENSCHFQGRGSHFPGPSSQKIQNKYHSTTISSYLT